MLVLRVAKARRPVLLPDVVVVWDAGEEVVRFRRDGRAIRPLFALQRHVALLLVVLEVFEQYRHAVASRVLQGERDEDEADPQQAELVPRDGVLLVEPLERG